MASLLKKIVVIGIIALLVRWIWNRFKEDKWDREIKNILNDIKNPTDGKT